MCLFIFAPFHVKKKKERFVYAIVCDGTCNSLSETFYSRCWEDEGPAKQLRPFLRSQAPSPQQLKHLPYLLGFRHFLGMSSYFLDTPPYLSKVRTVSKVRAVGICYRFTLKTESLAGGGEV